MLAISAASCGGHRLLPTVVASVMSCFNSFCVATSALSAAAAISGDCSYYLVRRGEHRHCIVEATRWPVAATNVQNDSAGAAAQCQLGCHAVSPKTVDLSGGQRFCSG